MFAIELLEGIIKLLLLGSAAVVITALLPAILAVPLAILGAVGRRFGPKQDGRRLPAGTPPPDAPPGPPKGGT